MQTSRERPAAACDAAAIEQHSSQQCRQLEWCRALQGQSQTQAAHSTTAVNCSNANSAGNKAHGACPTSFKVPGMNAHCILLRYACWHVTCMEECSSCRKNWHIIRAEVPADPAKLQGRHC